MPKISIKTNILTIFLTLIGLVALSLLYSQYYFSKKLAIEETNKTFNIISKNIGEHLRNKAVATRNILNIKSKDGDLLKPITFNPIHPSLEGLIQVLQINKNLHAIYFVQENGNFYEVINIQNRPMLFQNFNAPKLTQWVIIAVIGNQEENTFLDKNLEFISKINFTKKHNFHKRPWYNKALSSSEVITTKPYFFVNSNVMGKTYAKQIDDTGAVLAFDYTLEQLNTILALQKYDENTEIFILDGNGNKLASSELSASKKIVDEVLMKALLENKIGEVLYYKENEKDYYTILKRLANNEDFLGIKVDANKLLKPYKDNLQYSFLIALVLLLAVLPLILISTNLIVKPIRALILENNKIKNRKFSEVNTIDTNIIEFDELSDSLVSMSHSIQAYQKAQEELLDSIIKLIAEAIDAKSPYTGGHCARVPQIAQLLLNAASESKEGDFKDFSMRSKEALKEFEIGAWLHDCGKVTTPEYVVDKATKLETIYNRIHEVRMRFEVLWRDAEIEYLKNRISLDDLHVKQKLLRDDFAFIASANIGGEFMDADKQDHIKAIAQQQWQRNFDDRLGLGEIETSRYDDKESSVLPVAENLLSDRIHHLVTRENFDYEAYKNSGFKEDVPEYLYNYGEVYNLCIAKGTLSPEERFKINEHVIMSIKMLEKIPFPKEMRNVPEYAGTHHETLIGTGYPRKLTKDELSIPARIMAIADIFEALTASDRPYKKAKTLSESIKIMSFMVRDQHIDAELFKLFLSSGIYEIYAQKYLKSEQIDDVDIGAYC